MVGLFIVLTVVLVLLAYTYIKTCQVVLFKCVQFMVSQLSLNKARFEKAVLFWAEAEVVITQWGFDKRSVA